jgi:glycosyltransferase involved in cell wall biosynthesis
VRRRKVGRGRVAVVSHGFSPTVGGSERYHEFTARALSQDADVTVFTSTLNLPGAPADRATTAQVGPLRVEYLPSRWMGPERLVRRRALWSALRAFDPDVIWTNHPSPTADLGALYALVSRRPWVVTYHADVSRDRWSHRVYLHWESWLLRRARAVLVTGERYRTNLISQGVRPERLVVAPIGPLLGNGTLPTAPVAANPPDGWPFLFVGGLDDGHAYKRLDLLLEALAGLRDTEPSTLLEVVGDGNRRADWERRAEALGLSGRVRFLGRLEDAALAQRYAQARALVLPAVTSAEGFGIVATEAIQYGCPVVASSEVAVGDLLASDGAVARFEAAGAPGSLARILRVLLEDSAERTRLAEGAKRSAPKFAWAALLPATLAPVRSFLPAPS